VTHPFSLPTPPLYKPPPTREERDALASTALTLAERLSACRAELAGALRELDQLRAGSRSPLERALFRRCEEAEANAAALDMRNAELRERVEGLECELAELRAGASS
jgi:hypothetical protein